MEETLQEKEKEEVMTNIIDLFSDTDEKTESNEEKAKNNVIETLQNAMTDAKNHNAVNCAVILITDDDQIIYSHTNHYRIYTLIGAFEFLKNIILNPGKKR